MKSWFSDSISQNRQSSVKSKNFLIHQNSVAGPLFLQMAVIKKQTKSTKNFLPFPNEEIPKEVVLWLQGECSRIYFLYIALVYE